MTHLLLQLESPLETVLAFAKAAKALGAQVILNAAPAQTLTDELLRHVDVLIVNEGELAALTESDDLEHQLCSVQTKGPHTVIVTLGSEGCLARYGDEKLQLPAYKVTVRDTTAAGDTFTGVFAARLSMGSSLEDALRWATAASALACTHEGAQVSIPYLTEIEAALPLYQQQKVSI